MRTMTEHIINNQSVIDRLSSEKHSLQVQIETLQKQAAGAIKIDIALSLSHGCLSLSLSRSLRRTDMIVRAAQQAARASAAREQDPEAGVRIDQGAGACLSPSPVSIRLCLLSLYLSLTLCCSAVTTNRVVGPVAGAEGGLRIAARVSRC